MILPLKHHRTSQKTSILTNKNKLQADIKGLIFYRLLENILSNNDRGTKTDHKNELQYYEKRKKQVFTKIKVNNYRTQSLIDLILEILKDVKLWWHKNEYRKDIHFNIWKNISILETLRFELGKQNFQTLLKDLEVNMKIDNDFINKVITEIKEIKNGKNA